MKLANFKKQKSTELSLKNGGVILQHSERKDKDGDPLLGCFVKDGIRTAKLNGWVNLGTKVGDPAGVKTKEAKALAAKDKEIAALKAQLAAQQGEGVGTGSNEDAAAAEKETTSKKTKNSAAKTPAT